WARNRRSLAGPLVAGGSNIVALGRPADTAGPSALDVFYVSLNYDIPYADPDWNQSWRVIHAAWPVDGDWKLTPIADLDSIAASCGVTAARDSLGRLQAL